jgi:hypothetical protein
MTQIAEGGAESRLYESQAKFWHAITVNPGLRHYGEQVMASVVPVTGGGMAKACGLTNPFYPAEMRSSPLAKADKSWDQVRALR